MSRKSPGRDLDGHYRFVMTLRGGVTGVRAMSYYDVELEAEADEDEAGVVRAAMWAVLVVFTVGGVGGYLFGATLTPWLLL